MQTASPPKIIIDAISQISVRPLLTNGFRRRSQCAGTPRRARIRRGRCPDGNPVVAQGLRRYILVPAVHQDVAGTGVDSMIIIIAVETKATSEHDSRRVVSTPSQFGSGRHHRFRWPTD